jgi:lipopolysaccharide/colanic/teichoic acid biosynthesis glycosyltransferase
MRRRTRFLLVTLGADLASLLVAGSIASMVRFGTPIPWQAQLAANPRPMVGLLIIGVLFGSWASIRLVEPALPRPSYARVVSTGLLALSLVAVGSFFLRTYYSGRYTAITLGVWFVLAIGHRALRRLRHWSEQMVIITDEKQLAHDLAEAPHARLIDILGSHGEPPSAPLDREVTLVVDLRAVLSDGMASFVSSSVLAGSEVRPLTQVYEEHTGRIALVHLAQGWEISTPLERRAPYAPFKQAIESLLVVVTAPLWLLAGAITWTAIKLDSRGPAVFRQYRMGVNGRPFVLYKFRTMTDGADDDGPQFTSVDDPRITRLGRWLRPVRLDEVPQLWNVLKGDMSLVGPRAEQVPFVERFGAQIPFYRYRHLVRPGITGWAQVNSGYADDLDDTIEKLTFDLYYIRHLSPALDLSILRKSLWTVLTRKGAQ